MILAADAAASGGSGMLIFLPMLILLGGWMWWNSRKRQRESQEMTSAVEVGRDVVLRNGTVVTVVDQNDDYITVEVSPGVTQRWVPGAVSRVLPLPGLDLVEESTTDIPGNESDDDETKNR